MSQPRPRRDTGIIDYVKAWPQYLLPGHTLSRLMHVLTRSRHPLCRRWFTRWFARHFQVDMSLAQAPDLESYANFNAFFTRPLRPEVRPLVATPRSVACPVDGTLSQAGTIDQGRIFQAKGHDYSLSQLLGGDQERVEYFQDGSFATLYLSPRDYHRIHMPLTGTLRAMRHVPGRLFSVNPATTRVIPGLFARNERVVAYFDTEAGPMALVLVGAIFVASIETVWAGEVTPPAAKAVRHWHYQGDEAITLEKGQEMGRFNMGSTVIVLFGPQAVRWAEDIQPAASVQMGQHLADLC
jgi:phosphatidylserine decarboxylase